MNRTLPALALTALVALSGCAGLGSFGDRYGSGRYGGNDDYYESGRYGDPYAESGYYRSVERDAREYADAVDRYLRISNREERAIRDLVERRAYDLLRQTRARDHARVYPFPRRPGRAERFWSYVDRDVEQILDRRYREPYAYYNRYGADRYQEYYRYRRYDDRAGWVDTRRSDRRTPRRAETRRDDNRAAARARQQREEARRRDQRADRQRQRAEARREEARRTEARRAERERERREKARREETRRREAARERNERARSERSRERRRTEEAKENKKESETRSRRRTRRGGNND